MIPLLAPLLLKFPVLGRIPWRVVAAVAAVGLVWWQIAAYGGRREDAGRAAQIALYEAAERKAAADHAAQLAKVEETHNAATQTLRQERDAALARPATRTIRVRVPISATCPAPGAGDAGVLGPDPADRLLEIDDPGYRQFRQWLIEFAGRPADGG